MKFALLLLAFSALAASDPNADSQFLRGGSNENRELRNRKLPYNWEIYDYYQCYELFSCKQEWMNCDDVTPLVNQNSPGIKPGSVSLAFGPHFSLCRQVDAFHTGITIRGEEGDAVQTIAWGWIHDVGEDYIVVNHNQDFGCKFFGEWSPGFYVKYTHVKPVPGLHQGKSFYRGTKIGELISHKCTNPEGNEYTVTSLEFQVFVTNDHSGQRYDPRINPFYFLAYREYEIFVDASQDLEEEEDWVVTARIGEDEPIINFFTVVCTDEGKDPKEHFIDLSARKGIPKYPKNLDKTIPYLDAKGSKRVTHEGERYHQMQLVVPGGWYSGMGECTVEVCNIWKKQCKSVALAIY